MSSVNSELLDLKIWLGENSFTDELLTTILERTRAQILAYCNRRDFPDALRWTMINLAVIHVNRLGVEGQSSASEGSVSAQFGVLNVDLPESIRRELQQFRKIGVASE